jgi:transposase
MVEIATWFGVSHRVIATWRTRYADDCPFPEPDAMTGRTPGRARGRREEIENWERRRPGQGAGGGRPRKPASPPH